MIAFVFSCDEANLGEGLFDGARHNQKLGLVGDIALHQVLHIETHDTIGASDRVRVAVKGYSCSSRDRFGVSLQKVTTQGREEGRRRK